MGFRSGDDTSPDGEGPSLDQVNLISSTIDDGIFVLDRHGRFVAVNDVVLRETGFAREELIGSPASIVVDDVDAARITEAIQRRLAGDLDRLDTFEASVFTATGETIPIELRINVLTMDDEFIGSVGVARDISEQKQVEHALHVQEQHFQSLVEAIEDYAIFLLDASGRVTSWNTGAAEILGYDASAVLGRPLVTFYTEQDRLNDLPRRTLTTARERGRHSDVGWRVRGDGSPFWANTTLTAIEGTDGAIQGYIKIVRDMSERREYERRLEARRREVETELDEILGRISDAFIALDSELRFTHVNEHAEALLGRSEAELLGRPIDEAFPEFAVGAYFATVLEEGQPRTDTFQFPPVEAWLELTAYPSATGLSVYFRDVTDRKQREIELERYEFIMETVWDGIVLLDADGRFVELNRAFLDLARYERHELLGQPVSWVLDDEHADALALPPESSGGRPDVVEYDLRTAGGETVAVEARFGPYEHDDGTVGGVGVLRDISDRKARERTLEHQRRRLTAINHLNDVIRDISQTAIEASSREMVEQRVCADLAEQYVAAWISSIERGGDVEIRATAGDAAAVLAERPISDAHASGRACFLAVDDMQTGRDDVDGIAMATIPLAHDGRQYGVLAVSSEKPFGEPDREILEHLAEIVATSIHTIEQRKALVAQRVVELELEVDVDDHPLAAAMHGGEASIRLERVLEERGDAFTLFIEVEGFETGRFVRVIKDILDVRSLSLLKEDGNRHVYELTASDIPLIETIVGYGGRLLAIESGRSGVGVLLEIPSYVDVREVVERLREEVDGLMLRAQRVKDRERPTLETLDDVVAEELTERQRAVLETAYQAGYFEWPRRATGEEVAELLDVSSATFTEHLRIAQGKLFEHVFARRTR